MPFLNGPDPTKDALRRLWIILICAATAWTTLPCALAAGGPENALVVVNSDSWASTCIANEYIAARRIPPVNVVYLRDMPDFDRIGVEDFRVRILIPALNAAEERHLGGQIDYLLYSADFPTAIDVTADIGTRKFPQVLTQPAAINGLTFLYQFTLAKNPSYLGLNTNFYYRQIAHAVPDVEMTQEDRKTYLEAIGILQRKNGNGASGSDQGVPPPPADPGSDPQKVPGFKDARDMLITLKEKYPKNTELLYNLGCAFARLGDGDRAVGALRDAIDLGWSDMRTAEMDPDFATIRGRVDFGLLVARSKLGKFELIPTSGFRAAVGWLPSGQPVPPTQGMRYMLSTMLACTSGRGNSVTEALSSLKRSVAADGFHPKGTIYFMENKDVRSTAREWGFRRAAEKLREIGVWSAVETGELPRNKSDVAGAMIGAAAFDWASCGSTILPGAICEHLTSYGGAMGETAGQTPLTEFIRYGAAGASGTVTEPYAIQAKFPSPFIHYHYAQGCSLAEAFYQSVEGPYQLLIVGDALCAPWRKNLEVRLDEIKPGATLKGIVRLVPAIRSTDGIKDALIELFIDGKRIATGMAGKATEMDTSQVPDGPYDLVVAANGADPIATRGTLRIPVVIRNGSSKIRVTAPAGDWAWNKPFKLSANAPGAKSIAVFHNAREVATVPGPTGSVEIDVRTLGQGPVRLRPVAIMNDGKQVLAEPVSLNIKPPPALPPSRIPVRTTFADGFQVRPAGGELAIVEQSTGDWLEKAGVGKDGGFSMDAWFTVPATEVYQFQLLGPAKLRVEVDGHTQDWPRGKAWWFVPVHLAAGRHRLRIEGQAEGPPRLDVRFGGPGSRRLDKTRFQHAAPEEAKQN